MDNKTKCLYVAIAVLLVSNGYLLYRLGKTEPVVAEKKPVWVSGEEDEKYDYYYSTITSKLSDIIVFKWIDAIPLKKTTNTFGQVNTVGGSHPQWALKGEAFTMYVRDKKEIEKIDKYLGKK